MKETLTEKVYSEANNHLKDDYDTTSNSKYDPNITYFNQLILMLYNKEI